MLLEFSRSPGIGAGLGGIGVRGRVGQGKARSQASDASRRIAQRAPDRDGHGTDRPFECLRIQSADHPQPRAVGEPGNSLRQGTRHRAVDTTIARKHVHGAVASRARRGMEHAPTRKVPDAGRVPRDLHGYATAGFAANTLFCSYDTGLDRGFAHFEDYELGPLAAARTALVVDVAFKWLFGLARQPRPKAFDAGPLSARCKTFVLGWVLAGDRINAPMRSIRNSWTG